MLSIENPNMTKLKMPVKAILPNWKGCVFRFIFYISENLFVELTIKELYHGSIAERYPALESKYKEIVDGKQESGILNSLIGAARKFELDNLGHVLGP